MAERPVYIPAPHSPSLVEERFFQIKWHPGFAVSQKEKNIQELHRTAGSHGLAPILEISSKSSLKTGRHMSAFHMTASTEALGPIKLELAFQGSKVFEHGGPFTDLYTKGNTEIGQAKRDQRLKDSGRLIGFRFEGRDFPTEPKTTFYDWLYCSFLMEYRDWAVKLYSYAGFTDVEFNPFKSINCQARSAALFLSLMRGGELDQAMRSPEDFIATLTRSNYRPRLRAEKFLQSEPDHLFANH